MEGRVSVMRRTEAEQKSPGDSWKRQISKTGILHRRIWNNDLKRRLPGSEVATESTTLRLPRSRVRIRVLHQLVSEAVRVTFSKASALHQNHVSGADKPEI